VLDVKTGQSSLLYENSKYSEPTWLTETEILLIRTGDNGRTSLVVADVSDPASDPAEIASFSGQITNLKVRALAEDGCFGLACSAMTTRDGAMASQENGRTSYSSAKVYNSLFVRHWDSWIGDTFSSIWYGRLERQHDDEQASAGSAGYTLKPETGLVNALAGTKLSSPVPPFGGTGDFDVGPAGLAFVAKDPELCPASYTKTDLYFVPLSSFVESPAPAPKAVPTGSLRGYSASPVFSQDGKKLAFTRMRNQQYESDKPRLLVAPDIASDPTNVQEFYETADGEGGWDARPDQIIWGAGDKELFVTAEFRARNRVYRLPAEPSSALRAAPELLGSDEGSASSIALLASGHSDKLFITSSSAVDNNSYSILDPDSNTTQVLSSSSKQGKTFGLSRSQFGETWYKGATGEYDVHALVMRPSWFDKTKKYPLAFFIHGGPQGAWMDSWSTRWNPAIFAEQGYIVVAPNPTGSTGYGMKLQDAIQNQWGGQPYEDLVKCFEHIEKTMPYVDTDRAVALGASYGGYMISKFTLSLSLARGQTVT
jgi:dipeptidyl aminopeptidase/acylaminoacyl peptidase